MTGLVEGPSAEMDERVRKAPRTVAAGRTIRAGKAAFNWATREPSYRSDRRLANGASLGSAFILKPRIPPRACALLKSK